MKAAGPVEEHKRKISSDPDGSNMMIKTAGPATIPPGGKVKCVHETKAEFKIDFEDGSSATLYLADPGSSVAVRDKNNAVEYLEAAAAPRTIG